MRKLFKLVLLLVVFSNLTGCGTGSTQPSVMAGLFNFSTTKTLQLKGNVDGIDFDLKERIDRGSGNVLMSRLVRGSQSFDYFVEVIVDEDGKTLKGAVTRAKSGSLSMYYGTLVRILNSSVPDSAQVWTFAQDVSDHQSHLIRLGSDSNGLQINLQLIK